ncbi:Mpv17/PMP22 family protein [Rhodotorula paludigena]|uniref:Mpv17/PMP22 family protein n=1 Tax=Rhodotorula paludigena TaxID=86838 RepID=UPI0031726086
MSFIFRGYLRLLQRYTLPTQMATAASTSALGDVLYQGWFEGKSLNQFEWYKTQRMAIYGSMVWAPLSNRWHAVLNKINLGSKVKTVVARTVTDLALFSPFATCLFYTCQGLFEGRAFLPGSTDVDAPQCTFERLEERLWPTVQKQWALWGPANIINMSIVPVYARPPFSNFVAIGWNCFLAAGAARGGIPPAGHTISREVEIAVAAAEAME